MPRRTALTRNRINRVVNRVHLLCDHEWTLSELASIACLSKFHFLRVFQSVLNETPGQFVHRIRLERAARLLVYNREVSITDVAHSCGFGSSQTLSRAFRARFHSTPTQFRRANIYRVARSPHGEEEQRVAAECVDELQNRVQLMERPSYRVAYVRHRGQYGLAELGAFRQLREWTRQRGLLDAQRLTLGVGWDNSFITPEAQCRYDVCVPVPDDIANDDDMDVQVIPGGTFAVYRTSFPRGGGMAAWERFTQGWLARSSYQIDFRPSYEAYSPHRSNGDGHLVAELCLAVKQPSELLA